MDVRVKVRINDGDPETYDVLFLGCGKKEAMAIREGFSALDVNQDWSRNNQYPLTAAVRANSVLAELHQEYKDTIRDPKPTAATEEVEEYIEEDEFSDFLD